MSYMVGVTPALHMDLWVFFSSVMGSVILRRHLSLLFWDGNLSHHLCYISTPTGSVLGSL